MMTKFNLSRAGRTGVIFTFVSLAGIPASAVGQTTYISQSRSVSVETQADGGSQSLSAPSFGPFVETLNRVVPSELEGQSFDNIAVAAISCVLDAPGVKIRGRLSGGGRRGTTTAIAAVALASNDIVLSIDRPWTYVLAAHATDIGETASNTMMVRVTREADEAVLYESSQDQAFDALSVTFDLQPGSYRFEHFVRMTADATVSHRDFEVEFGVLECPADLDDGSMSGHEDMGVTIEDLIYFLDRFGAGHQDADLDDGTGTGHRDDAVTIDDMVYFLTRYAAGC